MKKPFVFISYSTKEAETANLVYSYLEENGFPCWIASQNIEGGDSFAVQIVDAIGDCSAFVMIASENSNISPHVSNELSLAFGAKKKIIPFKLQNYELSKANIYFLNQAQWIDASENLNDALKHLLNAVRMTFPDNTEVLNNTIKTENNSETKENSSQNNIASLTREEIVNILLSKIDKYSYCVKDRVLGANYETFKKKAQVLFENTVSMYFKGRSTSKGIDFVDIIIDTLSQRQGISIRLQGLPGCAKNLLIQLAYYKMLENFRNNQSDYLPIYLSASYYEKINYTENREREEMFNLLKEECSEYFNYLDTNPIVKPILLLEAVREHIVSDFAPEDVIAELWNRFEKFNRLIAIDVGLIKDRNHLKRSISLTNVVSGYTFKFRSIPITDKKSSLTVIKAVLDMYNDKYDTLDAENIYKAMFNLGFSTLDIFTVRLVATELSQGHSVTDISLVDMYEKLAFSELKGNRDKMLNISRHLYDYIFGKQNDKSKPSEVAYWSLPHKHATYLEFMIAYYFCYAVRNAVQENNFDFLRITMNTISSHFTKYFLNNNYNLQQMLLNIIAENYESFDVTQKSNAAFWLGELSYEELADKARQILEKEYKRLFPIVKNNNSKTLINRQNHYLFRSICLGLISQDQTNILDDYLCLIIINDIANALNRGAVIQYTDENYSINMHVGFYMDNDLSIGEQTIRILCSKIDMKLHAKKSGFIETDILSLLTLVQARMHVAPENLPYNLSYYAEKCLGFIQKYQNRPRSIVSEKLLFYFQSVSDDLTIYIKYSRFDAAFNLYESLSKIKETTSEQWQKYQFDNPESIAERTLNTWIMAMIYLPLEYKEADYNKQDILDMLLVHNMVELDNNTRTLPLDQNKYIEKQNIFLRKAFLKGTFPEVANMTRYYNAWTGYYNGKNINSRIAHDINIIQMTNTFFENFISNKNNFTLETVKEWLNKNNSLSTDIGYDLFDRIITRNPFYRKAIDNLITSSDT